MADNETNPNTDYIVPVISEEVHADAVPVETGTVRVVKRVDTHEELLEEQLRKGRVEVKRVRTHRIVDGPQQPQQVGETLIIPVVSEVLRIQKEWVVTEEIHVTQHVETETVQQRVPVNREVAEIERLDESGQIVNPRVAEVNEVRPLASRAAATPASGRSLTQRESIIRRKP